MFKVIVDYKTARVCQWETLTTGSVGVNLKFEFSNEWNGLKKTVCFENGLKELPSIPIYGCEATIPVEALRTAGTYLKVGVYGEALDGTLIIPTVYAVLGTVHQGAEKTDRPATPPRPDWTSLIEDAVNKAVFTVEDVKTRADNGEFNGVSAYEAAKKAGYAGSESEWLDFVQANGRAAQSAAIKAEQASSNAQAAFSSANAAADTARLNAEKAKSEADRIKLESVSKSSVKQNTGSSDSFIMSQKAVTDALNGKADIEGEFELIETINLSVESTIKRDAEPDGTPYNFKSVMIKIQAPLSPEFVGSFCIGFMGNSTITGKREPLIVIFLSFEKNHNYTTIWAKPEDGFWMSKLLLPTGANIQTYMNYISPVQINTVREYDHPAVNYLSSAKKTLPAGSKIEIWGIRA